MSHRKLLLKKLMIGAGTPLINAIMNMRTKFISKLLSVFAMFALIGLIAPPMSVDAAYDKDLLISNANFVDHSSMSESQIINFLDDEGGDLLNSWVDSVNLYQEDDRFQVTNNRCLVHKATGMTAAEIIKQASSDWQATYVEWRYQGNVVSKNPAVYNGPVDSCNTVKKYPDINLQTIGPKVILTTLEKEQSLVTTDGGYSPYLSGYYNPACNVSSSSPYYGHGGCKNNNYKLAWAMGYGVPDTGGKRHQYKGFYNQVMYGAWQLRFNYEHSDGTTDWDGTGGWGYSGPVVGQTINIDGTNVTIENRATASLYYYTPHLHGNQNFVALYEQWFGSTTGKLEVSGNLLFSPSSPVIAGVPAAASFKVRNTKSTPVTIDKLVAAVRDMNGKNVNFPTVYNITIDPGETYQYYQYRSFSTSGTHTMWIAAYTPSGDWSSTWPASANNDIRRERTFTVRQPNLKITKGLVHSPSSTSVGQQKAVSFSVKNDDTVPITIDRLVVAVRDKNGKNVNFSTIYNITIKPGDNYQYYKYATFNTKGNHDMWIAAYTPSGSWSSTWPASANSNILRERTFTVN